MLNVLCYQRFFYNQWLINITLISHRIIMITSSIKLIWLVYQVNRRLSANFNFYINFIPMTLITRFHFPNLILMFLLEVPIQLKCFLFFSSLLITNWMNFIPSFDYRYCQYQYFFFVYIFPSYHITNHIFMYNYYTKYVTYLNYDVYLGLSLLIKYK